MSRIAKQPVEILKGVSVELKDQMISVKGPQGVLAMDLNSEVAVKQDDSELAVRALSGSKLSL